MEHLSNVEETLAAGKTLYIKPQGTSMLPFIRAGRDAVYIKKTPYEGIKKGDVVLYRSEQGILVLHRVCKKTPTAFYTVGDHQLLSAGPYPSEALLGKMVALERRGRYMEAERPSVRLFGRVWLARRRVLLIVRSLLKD